MVDEIDYRRVGDSTPNSWDTKWTCTTMIHFSWSVTTQWTCWGLLDWLSIQASMLSAGQSRRPWTTCWIIQHWVWPTAKERWTDTSQFPVISHDIVNISQSFICWLSDGILLNLFHFLSSLYDVPMLIKCVSEIWAWQKKWDDYIWVTFDRFWREQCFGGSWGSRENWLKTKPLKHVKSLIRNHWTSFPYDPGLSFPKNWKRPNLAISSFRKCYILKNEKRPIKMGKPFYFWQTVSKMVKWQPCFNVTSWYFRPCNCLQAGWKADPEAERETWKWRKIGSEEISQKCFGMSRTFGLPGRVRQRIDDGSATSGRKHIADFWFRHNVYLAVSYCIFVTYYVLHQLIFTLNMRCLTIVGSLSVVNVIKCQLSGI